MEFEFVWCRWVSATPRAMLDGILFGDAVDGIRDVKCLTEPACVITHAWDITFGKRRAGER